MTDKIGVTELNNILLNSMSNSWSKQAYVQGFDYETYSFKNDVNMFKRTEIDESIYESVVTPPYKKTTRSKYNRTGLSRNKRGEYAS